MEIVVLSASRQKNCTLKDVAGGFGTVFTVGNSPFAKLLEIAKRRIASIPNITLAYLDSLLSSHGANVRVLEIRRRVLPLPRADLYLIASYGRAAPPAGLTICARATYGDSCSLRCFIRFSSQSLGIRKRTRGVKCQTSAQEYC